VGCRRHRRLRGVLHLAQRNHRLPIRRH
jgi:hypothetical protein